MQYLTWPWRDLTWRFPLAIPGPKDFDTFIVEYILLWFALSAIICQEAAIAMLLRLTVGALTGADVHGEIFVIAFAIGIYAFFAFAYERARTS